MENKSSRDSTQPPLTLVIGQAGNCVAIYDDAWEFAELGKVQIARASHVEPDAAGNWLADLAPVGGPVLGPFTRRNDAIAAEQGWLNRNLHQIARPADK